MEAALMAISAGIPDSSNKLQKIRWKAADNARGVERTFLLQISVHETCCTLGFLLMNDKIYFCCCKLHDLIDLNEHGARIGFDLRKRVGKYFLFRIGFNFLLIGRKQISPSLSTWWLPSQQENSICVNRIDLKLTRGIEFI